LRANDPARAPFLNNFGGGRKCDLRVPGVRRLEHPIPRFERRAVPVETRMQARCIALDLLRRMSRMMRPSRVRRNFSSRRARLNWCHRNA
jgi:hypothetical protein